ncbi:hypothetical protein KA005_78280 [bacterium]|nr:hypothetical protein [bacterium]
MAKTNDFERFVAKYRRKRNFGLGVVKAVITVILIVGIFFGCVMILKQQEGFMPGGTIPGQATGQ